MSSLHRLLAELIKWEVLILVGGFCGIVMVRLLTGGINTRYLLWGRRQDGTRYFSPERVQLLVALTAMGVQYLMTAAAAGNGEMPMLPDGGLQLLGLSNVIYLGGKGWNLLRPKQN